MKKITQNLTNVKAWQSIVFAFMFLFSLTINSQTVGEEFLANPGVNTTSADSDGVDGGGNFPANLGGWGAGAGGAYASASDANGDCLSPDRMFKFFKVGSADGQFVNQTITALPAGNYNWSLSTKWGDAGHASGPTGSASGNLPTWSAEGDNQPKFTIMVQDAEGAWVADQATVTSEPATVLTWLQDSGTWTNTETRDVKIKIAKNGGTAAGGGSNTDKLMYIDDVSLTYASALETSSGCDLNINMIDSYGDSWNGGYLTVSINGELFGEFANEGDAGAGEAETVAISTSYGDAVTFDFTCGSYCSETSFNVTDAEGNVVASGGGSDNADATFECLDPDAINLVASVTTDGPLASFSFDIANFVVGSPDADVDGHIRWTIFDSSDLENAIFSDVLYSSDDVAVPLPNGNHTMVFSLVDSNSVALDPAVESAVAFSTYAITGDDCVYTLTLNDQYDDGWGNADGSLNTIDVLVNGVVAANYTIGAGSLSFSIPVSYGEVVTLSYNIAGSGNWASENSFVLADSEENILVDGDSTTNGEPVSCNAPLTPVTFNVDMSQYGLGEGDTVHVNGEFTGWCGDCEYNLMSDEDGDGVYTLTLDLEQGSYFWKYTVNAWSAQEGFSEVIDGCTAQNGDNFDRQVVVGAEEMELTYCWNSCDAECPTGPAAIVAPWSEDFEDGDISDWSIVTGGDETNGWFLADLSTAIEGGSIAMLHQDDQGEINNYLVSPLLDLTSLINPILSYDEGSFYSDFYTYHGVLTSVDFDGTNAATATWIEIAEGVLAEELVSFTQEYAIPTDVTGIAFNYQGNYSDWWILDNVSVTEALGEPNFVTADPANAWGGFMSVFDLEDDGTQGGYVYGSGWAVADLQTTLNVDTPNIILEPNFNTYANAINSGEVGELEFWTNGEGGGNKFMEATTQVESFEAYNGADLTFTGTVLENTLVDGYTAVYFIKCLDPNNGYQDTLGGDYVFPIVAGEFSVTVDGSMLPAGKLVQFGFTVYGPNANAENPNHGRVVIGEQGLSTVDVTALDMIIYPNPSNGSYVTIQSPVNGVKYVEVFDITGKRLINTSLSADTLDVSSISTGMYFVKVTIEGQSKTSKLIIR
jgi:hypothetical protein